MKLRLKITKGTKSQTLDRTSSGTLVIGRDAEDIPLDDAQCSKRHAILYEDSSGDLRVKDLNSKNGTMVNQRKIEDASLKVGDRVEIGATIIEIVEFRSTENIKGATVARDEFHADDATYKEGTKPQARKKSSG